MAVGHIIQTSAPRVGDPWARSFGPPAYQGYPTLNFCQITQSSTHLAPCTMRICHIHQWWEREYNTAGMRLLFLKMLAFAPRILSNCHFHLWNWDSSVRVVTNRPRTRLQRNRGSISNADKTFSLLQNLKTGSAAHPAYFSMGSEDLYQGVKQLGHETHHSPPSNPKIKYECSYTSKSHVSSWRGERQIYLYLYLYFHSNLPKNWNRNGQFYFLHVQ